MKANWLPLSAAVALAYTGYDVLSGAIKLK